MPRIKRTSIDEVRNRADIVALIGDYTSLKKAGASWRGLSPFTNEKTPSFYVQPHKGFFYCFSTAQGGDIFRFLILKEGLTFQEAVERVANRFNIPLQYEEGTGAPTREERSLRAQLLAIHDHAATLYANAFHASTDEAKAARDYWLNKRRFSLEIATQFQIGYAPRDGGNLAKHLLKEGFAKDALEKSGLFTGTAYSPDPLRWHHKFYGRLMVPIRDIQGRTVAFTARLLPFIQYEERDPARESKYVNSPETEVFHKSQILFNLDKARTAIPHNDSTAPLILVEGQLDAIRAATNGAPATIASQGTSIGPDHLALITRYTRHLHLLLDADRAGQEAILRLLPLATRAGIEVHILTIPDGKDPDEYLAANPAGWENIAATATPALEHAVKTLLPPGQTRTAPQKLTALQTLFEIIAESQSAIFRHYALERIARLTSTNPIALNRDYTAYETQRRRHAAPAQQTQPKLDALSPKTEDPRLNSNEEILFSLLLNQPEIAHPIAQILNPEWVNETIPAGRLLNRATAEILENLWEGHRSAMHLAENSEENNLIAKLITNPADTPTLLPAQPPQSPAPQPQSTLKNAPSPIETANNCLASLHRRYVKEKTNKLTAAIAQLPADDVQTAARLQRQKNDLKRQLSTPPTLPIR